MYIKNTWSIDFERRMDTEVFNIFQRSFPQNFLEAGLHISLSDILDKEIGLGEQFLNYFINSNKKAPFWIISN